MSDELCFLSAADLRRRISRKEISPSEVTSAVIARAERLQPELNCFITLCADKALAQAKDAERRIMAGEPLRVLEGIPFTVKDIVNTKDVRTTFGAIPYKDNVPDHDAVAVARLRAAGAAAAARAAARRWRSRAALHRSRWQPMAVVRPASRPPATALSG